MLEQLNKYNYRSLVICLAILICRINAQTSQASFILNESSANNGSSLRGTSYINSETSSTSNALHVEQNIPMHTKLNNYKNGNLIANINQSTEITAKSNSIQTNTTNVYQNKYNHTIGINGTKFWYEMMQDFNASSLTRFSPPFRSNDEIASLPDIPSSVNGGDMYINETESIIISNKNINHNNDSYGNKLNQSIIKQSNAINEDTDKSVLKRAHYDRNETVGNKSNTDMIIKSGGKIFKQSSANLLNNSRVSMAAKLINCTDDCSDVTVDFDYHLLPDYVVIDSVNMSGSNGLCLYLHGTDCKCDSGPLNCADTIADLSCTNATNTCKLKRNIGDLYIIGWYGCADYRNSNLTKCISKLINEIDNESDKNTVIIIIMSVLLPIALCVAVFAIICCQKNRKNICGVKNWKMSVPTKNTVNKRVDKVPTEGNAVINMELHSSKLTNKSKPIPLNGFNAYYQLGKADSNLKFAEEFEMLKNNCGRKNSSRISQMSINKPKNRFVNILPYDHSIVRLKARNEELGSDYINANFIPGYNREHEYIACQGPMYSTVNDFFRMIIEQNVKIIVMLTQCIEKGRQKCEKYWPSDDDTKNINGSSIPSLSYDDIRIDLEEQVKHKDFFTRHLKLIKGEVTHTVIQYHYSQWPDFGCPQHPLSLIHLIEVIRDHLDAIQNNNDEQKYSDSPILVHCSAGVGRSGTFIAVDRIWQMLKHVRLNSDSTVVDIFGTVCDMRKYRPNMVQTEDQYIYIYDCVKYLIEKIESEIDLRHHLDTEISKTEENFISGEEEDNRDVCRLNKELSEPIESAFENKSFIKEETRETTDL